MEFWTALRARIRRRTARSWVGVVGGIVFALVIIVVVCVGFTAGGDRAWGSQTLAMELDGGHPVLLVYTCAGGRPVVSLDITKPNFHGPTDEVLWQIQRISPTRSASETVERIRVGDTPAGYRSVKELSGPLPSGRLDAGVTRFHPEGVLIFNVRDLKAGRLAVEPTWYGLHGSVTESKFLSVNRKNC